MGHNNHFGSEIIDKIVQKGNEYKDIDNVLDFYKYHNYLMYFPHYTTTIETLRIIKNTDKTGEKLFEFIKQLAAKCFIKINTEIVNEIDSIDIAEYSALEEKKELLKEFIESIKERENF